VFFKPNCITSVYVLPRCTTLDCPGKHFTL